MRYGGRFFVPTLGYDILTQVMFEPERVTLRTFGVMTPEQEANTKGVYPWDEARATLIEHAPFVGDQRPAAAMPKGSYFAITAIPGNRIKGTERAIYAYELSQVGFSPDPDIIGTGAWSEYGVWQFDMDFNGMLMRPYNRTIDTYLTKESRYFHATASHRIPVFRLIVPFRDTTLERCTFYSMFNPKYGCVHNIDDPTIVGGDGVAINEPIDRDKNQHMYGVVAHMEIDGPDTLSVDAKGEYVVKLVSPVDGSLVEETADVHLEVNCGYLAYRKVVVDNGVARFSLRALDLTPGTQIKLKAGYRYFTGMTEKIITVV